MTNQTRKSKTVQIVILLMTAICMLAAMLILAACDKNGVTSEQNPPIVETIETDYGMSYLFQGKDATEVNFVYKPKYSGRYVFTAAENSLLPTSNGVNVEDGQIDYYDQNKEYLFNFKVTDPTNYNIVSVNMKPEVVGASARIEVKRNNKYLMLCHISEPALYTFETGGCDFKIYDSSYKQIESVGGDAYFLGSIGLEYVFIVLDRFLYYEDITVDFFRKKLFEEPVLFNDASVGDHLSISGHCGEVKFLMIEVGLYKEYIDRIIVFGLNNSEVSCKLFAGADFDFIPAPKGDLSYDNFSYYCFTESLKNGKYYLRLEFCTDFDGELTLDNNIWRNTNEQTKQTQNFKLDVPLHNCNCESVN